MSNKKEIIAGIIIIGNEILSGSTITKKVKQDSLAVERSVQIEVKNWAKRKNKK